MGPSGLTELNRRHVGFFSILRKGDCEGVKCYESAWSLFLTRNKFTTLGNFGDLKLQREKQRFIQTEKVHALFVF